MLLFCFIDTLQTRVAQALGQEGKEALRDSHTPPVAEHIPDQQPSPPELPRQDTTDTKPSDKQVIENSKKQAVEKDKEDTKKTDDGRKNYAKSDITSSSDFKIRKKLDEADDLVDSVGFKYS